MPLTLTKVPIGAKGGETAPTPGVTAKFTPLLPSTTTGPELAPAGTAAVMLLCVQLVEFATIPLNVTAFATRLEPKFEPLIVTGVPTSPEVGDRVVIVGLSSGSETWES